MMAIDRKYYYDEQKKQRKEDWLYPIDLPKKLLSKVLLVAGEFHSGKTMKTIRDRILEIGAGEIRTCVMYYQTGIDHQIGKPDYWGKQGKTDYLMPWQKASFLRTWKDEDDAKKREIKMEDIGIESLMNSFFLIRHAQTQENLDDRFIGSGSDVSINTTGRIEAQNIGKFLKDTIDGLDLIYCSPMKRCIQTANEIIKFTGGEIISDERLMEIDYGLWENKRRCEIPEDEMESYMNFQDYQIPGSKYPLPYYRDMANQFLEDMKSQKMHGKRILVVTHKSFGRILVQAVENSYNTHFRTIPMYNSSVRKIYLNCSEMSVQYYIKVMDGGNVVSEIV